MKSTTLSACAAIAAIFFALNTFAQNPWCGSAERHTLLLQQYPGLAQQRGEAEQLYRQYLQSAQKGQRALVTIPVVVHVVHDGDPVNTEENISDEQILSQIEALNIDYRKQNPDTANIPSVFKPLAADFEIEFCLAARTPDGQRTTGIERINGQRNSWTIATADEFKPSTIWDPSKYLNIWVMRLGGTSSSTLGYAQFPGMPDSTDGVVVDYKAFGTIGDLLPKHNLGKTLTHEVGHWLGLRHTWGDDNGACNQDDDVPDTPVQGAENYGCPTFPKVSCNNGPNGDMFMNYMDYVDDDCSYMFTVGQKSRADFFLNNDRASIKTSNGCEALPVYERDMAITELVFPTEDICTTVFTPVIKVKNLGTAIITSMLLNVQVDGVGLNQYPWQGALYPDQEDHIFLPEQSLPLGAHSYYVYLSALNGAADQNVGNEDALVNFDITSLGIGEPIPAQEEGFESGVLPSGWTLQNPGNNTAWQVDSLAGANGSSFSALFDNHTGSSGNNPRGTRDGLITEEYDFSNAYIPFITFSVAYARRNPVTKDTLILYYSLDCGASWKRLWEKTNSTLATAADKLQKFVPASSEWRDEMVWIHFLEGQGKVQFKFENYSDWGNVVYVDNFKINLTAVGIGDTRNHAVQLDVFPNPSSGIFHVQVTDRTVTDFTMEVLDIAGRSVMKTFVAEQAQWSGTIDLSGFSKGLYLLRVSSENAVSYKKLLVE